MLLGLVTDVHSHAEELAQALKVLRKRGVDQVITLGDTCDVFAPSDGSAEITSMLAQCGAIGVWGNHDYTLCRDPPDDFRQRFTAQTLEWMSDMQPSLEIDGCYFSHRAADIDPHDIAALWSCEEETIDLHKRAMAGFHCVSHQRQFIGHYHQWALMTPAGRNEWRGEHPIYLTPGMKHFVVVDAVFNGSCAVFNTTTGWLEPQHFETPQGSGRRFWAGDTGCD
jgi:hypothetical protein